MRYDEAFRRTVVEFVRDGGSKAEAHRRFGVNRPTIRAWLALGDDLAPRHRKLDREALRKAYPQDPCRPLADWASEYGVHASTIHRALRQMNFILPRRPAGATVADALKVAETHEFMFEPAAYMSEHEELQRLACARSDEEGETTLYTD
jgi:transposase-like protein